MKSLHLDEILVEVGGQIVQGPTNPVVTDVVVYPKYLENSELYFHLYSRNKINWDYMNQFSSIVIITDELPCQNKVGPNITLVIVDHIEVAYWKFINYYRGLFDIPVIGVTGTCGKSTTKEMIKHLLTSDNKKVCATYKSSNSLNRNLPYLMSVDDSTDACVIEMGISHRGDLLTTCKYFKPQIGIITTIGIDHLDQFKTLERYIEEKGTMLRGLDNKGTLILNGDNSYIKNIDVKNYAGKLITFGLHSSLDYWASDIKFGQGGMNAILHHGKFSYPLFIPGYGEHNIVNALASIAAVHTLGMDLKKASQLMSSFRHIESHLEISKGINGSTVIDDSWSSNPTSIKAALSVLDEISHNKKSVFVIGRISLLGEAAKEQYGQVAKLIVEHKVDTLITIGSETQEVADKVLELGMDKSAVHHCNDASSALQKMMETASEDTIILIKSSMYDSNTDLINKIRLQE